MKKILILSLAFTALLSLGSCSQDFMDIPQKGVQSSESSYIEADAETANSFITAAYFQYYYAGIVMNSYTYRGASILLDCLAGESLVGNKNSDAPLTWNPFREYTIGSQNGMIQVWWSAYYNVMYMCNLIIEHMPKNEVCDPSVKNRVIAEARTLRAIVMMSLVQLWGNPPLADHIMDGTEGNTPAEQSWAFILSELEDAAQALPSKSGAGAQKAIGGRLTKEAAYAYLGKAYLWKGDYANAAKYLDMVISSGKYSLLSNFDDMNLQKGDFSDEYIWEFNLENNANYKTGQAGGFIDIWFTAWNQERMKMPDQMIPMTGFGYGSTVSESFASFMEEHDGTDSPRYKGTLICYEDLFDESRFTYNTQGDKGVTGSYDNCAGYFQMKYAVRNENLVEGWTSVMNLQMAKNYPFMRYAEVLLNYAEAVAQGGKAGSISGLDALNLVRSRAGLDAAPSLDMNNASYGVKAERRAELYGDGARFIDLVRWGDAPTVLKDTGKYRYNFLGYKDGRNNVLQDKSKWNVEVIKTDGNGWDDKYKAFPYPFVEITANEALVQNPGW